MTCREVVDFLDRYCDGELTRFERASFRVHLAMCGNCRRYLATYRKTIRLSKAALGDLDQPAPADVPEELVQAILAARRK